MSDEAAAPAASEGLSAASAILAAKRAKEPAAEPVAAAEPAATTEATPEPAAPAAEPEKPAEAKPDPDEAQTAHNKRLLAEARAKREAERLRKEAEADRAAAAKEREEAAALRAERSEWEKTVAEARRDPLAFLDRTGLTIDDLVRAKLSGEVDPELLRKDESERTAAETKQLREELQAFKASIAKEKEEAQNELRRAKAEHAERAIKAQIESVVSADPKKYALINKLGEHDEVYKLIEGRYVQSKGEVLLSPAEAADLVEKFHRDRQLQVAETDAFDDLIDSLPQEKRAALIARLTNAAASTPAAPAGAPGKPAPQAKTTPDARAKSASALTANNVTSPAMPAADDNELEDRESFIERKKRELREKKLAAASKGT